MNTISENFVLDALAEGVATPRSLQKLRHKYSKEFKIPVLLNIDLIKAYRSLIEREEIKISPSFFALIQKRSVRTLSGIAPLSIFLKDEGCPGKCVFCPTEKNMPKSYLSTEPGMLRAVLNNFDPFRQVHNRLRAFEATGHNIDKIELIVQGGTFSAYSRPYQVSFLRSAFNAMNSYMEARDAFILDDESKFKYAKFTNGEKHKLGLSGKIDDAKKLNETSKVRCIGLTLETRPDWVNKKELKRLRWLGATRLEIGVQHTHNDVLIKNKRGHGRGHVIRATKLMKDAGFKFTYHMMPGLMGSTREKDRETLLEIFENPDFRPDQMKFYPCVVTDFSELTKLWKSGQYEPMQDQDFIDLACDVLPHVPEWVRISRVIRDIPATDILAGTKTSNLRQVIEKEMKKRGLQCRDIRAREPRKLLVSGPHIAMKVEEYDASGGKEFFISFEDTKNDMLLAFLRLRIPSQYFEKKRHFMKVLEGCALVREIHTYGAMLEVGEESLGHVQHMGLGGQMIAKAEEICAQFGLKKLAVIAGIGVREYFRDKGFTLKSEYMIKNI